MTTWTVEAAQINTRLDVFLAGVQSERTRSGIQKAIQRGLVTVNGQPTSVHRFLKEGDVIELKEETAKKAPTKSLKDMPLPVIVKETADWIVVNKPAGLLVHPSVTSNEPTLADWFLERYPEVAKVGENPIRPGVVHRLDRDVSGLLVLAKTQMAFDALKKDFAQRRVEKRYLAFVHGEILQDEDDIKLKIARSSSKARMAARPEKAEGKAAWTHIKVRERFVGATLLDVEILSGRTHQIRAHLHGIGHPVIGDTLYAIKQTDRNIPEAPLLLQSVHLSFNDPTTGTREIFDLPAEAMFNEMRAKLKAQS